MSPWAWLLLASLGANALLGWAYMGKTEAAAVAASQRDEARGLATACSDGVEALRELADKGKLEGAAAIKRAQDGARDANTRANAELSRPQAVPGDACESAKVETRQWLEKRRATP